MRIPERASNFSRAAWLWLNAILTILLAGAMLTAGYLPLTTLLQFDPWSALYKHQTGIQLTVAAFAGFCPAIVIYFTVAGQRFVATTIIAFIFMSATAIATVLFGVAEERLGLATLLGLIGFPTLAAVATKAANIASKKECDNSVYKKFKESLKAALDVKNFAELLLWTTAWASGGFGVFFLLQAIGMW